jgi:hypothetical protein
MRVRLLHGHGEGHGPFRLLAEGEGRGDKKGEAKNDHLVSFIHFRSSLHLSPSSKRDFCPQ